MRPHSATVAGGNDGEDGATGEVQNAGTEAGVRLLEFLYRFLHGDDGRQVSVITVIEKLKEFLLSPFRGTLGAQVVEDQKGGVAHFFESLVV